MILLVAILLAVVALPHPWGLVAVAGGAVVEIGEASFWLRWSRRRSPQVGLETMVGRDAVVATPCRPRGHVRVDGELWAAVCEEGAGAGDAVRIVGVDGLTVRVAPR